MSETPAAGAVPSNPLANGLRYHTICQNDRMLHVGDHHLLLVDYATGGIMIFEWDETIMALLAAHKQQEEKKKLAAELLAQSHPQRAAKAAAEISKAEAGVGSATLTSESTISAIRRIKEKKNRTSP